MKIKVDLSLTVYNINIDKNKYTLQTEERNMDDRFYNSNNDYDTGLFGENRYNDGHGAEAESVTSEYRADSTQNTASYSNPYSYSEAADAKSDSIYNPYSQRPQYGPSNTMQTVPSSQTVHAQPSEKKKKSSKPLFAVIAICASLLISGGSFYAGVNYFAEEEKPAASDSVQTSSGSGAAVANANTVALSEDSGEVSSTITQVVEEAMPSMVAINTIIETQMSGGYGYFYNYIFGDDYNQTYESSASGSGIIIGQNDEELLIVTNYHVIEDSKEIAVEFIDGESYEATVKGTASDNDLAVISVKLSDMSADTLSQIKVAVLGDSTALKLGEPAIAIGNSLGYGQSVTVGYISATERTVQLSDKTMTLLQTDAAINPGNSGGALLNIKGEVIGINSAKLSDTSVEGTGYAIPISDAAPIINDLMSSTYVADEDKPYLGIYGSSVPETYQTRFDWPAGVYVSRVVDGSPAQLAGLQTGDIITAIDGREVASMEDLENILADCKVGDKISITITRTDDRGTVRTGTVTATLIARGDGDEIAVG